MKGDMSKIGSFTIKFESRSSMTKETSVYDKRGEGIAGATNSSQDLTG